MELAFAHNNMDFDSLAAQFALTKLFPNCKMVLGYPLTGNLRSFISLNRNYLPIVEIKYVELAKVTAFFLVDCQHFDRLDTTVRKLIDANGAEQSGSHAASNAASNTASSAAFNSAANAASGAPSHAASQINTYPDLTTLQLSRPLTIFDHHERDSTSLMSVATSDSLVESVGAATTILVEKIRKQKIVLSQFDATLLAIGIFEDTGCLTYAGTTPRDAECIAYLIQNGADLSVVREYIRPKMEQEQLLLLEQLLKSTEIITVEGHRFAIATTEVPKYIEGLASITRQLVDLEGVDGAFTVVHMKDRVHVVGRADPRVMSVKTIVQSFGGDGHPGAGSAVVKGARASEIAERVKTILYEKTAPQPVARDLMVSPVRTIRSSVSMDEAGRLMLRYGLDGLVVSEDDNLLGVVSRRDIDQSSHHKLGHARVSGFMSKPVISISADTPLSQIQQIMLTEGVGRLPVIDDKQKLIGLVSRRDVLNSLFGSQYARDEDEFAPPSHSNVDKINLSEQLKLVDQDTSWLCRTIGETASACGMHAYAVGGFVRDLLLDIANFDLDYVIESTKMQKGPAQDLAHELALRFPDNFEVTATHDRFQTATLVYRRGSEIVREIDLSTARTEFYEYPAALPEVEASRLEQDLRRRDFTINALAVSVNPDHFGELTDHFDGLADLENKVIRTLHPFSFIEDPTRMVRAARFAGRLGFTLDAKTKEQARRASQMGIFDDLGGVRIKTELKLILDSPHRMRALNLLAEFSGKLSYLDAQLEYSAGVRKSIRRAERLLDRYTVDEHWIVYLGALLSELPPERLSGVLERLMLTNHQKEVIESGLDLHRFMPLSMNDMRRSQLYDMMHGKPRAALAIAAAAGQVGTYLRRSIKLYLEELADTKLEISGADLIASGIKPGPKIGEALKHVMAERLDGQVNSREQQLKLALAYFN